MKSAGLFDRILPSSRLSWHHKFCLHKPQFTTLQ